MAQRLLQVTIPATRAGAVQRALADQEGLWVQRYSLGDEVRFEILTATENVEAVLDPLQDLCRDSPDARVLVLQVETSLPAAAEPPPEAPPARQRISREELYQDVLAGTRIHGTYVVLVVLSAVVAGIGLWRSMPAVVIGAMVIAPLLGPNIALGLATTLADGRLAALALRANLLGVALALAVALLIGAVWGVGVDDHGVLSAEIRDRTHPHVVDLVLALAAGTAGALAFTTKIASSLVGVMVAVALLPPLVVFGMCLAAGLWREANGALLLLAGNVLCVNLAAVLTFLFQGITPRSWWKSQEARRAVRIVVAALITALVALAVVLLALQR